MKSIKITMLFLSFLFCLGCEKSEGDEGKKKEVSYMKEETEKRKLTLEERIELLRTLKPVMPIENATFTSFYGQLPNAPRAYRNGYHEGIDFYDGFCSVKIEEGTPVLAIADGEIIRVDSHYVEIDPEERDKLLQEAHEVGDTPESTLDLLRGRQVWIDHGNGIITRYCHLSGVESGVKGSVEKGTVIGFVGGSGTKSKTPHLHFEIRLGDDFLGRGNSPEENKKLLDDIFQQ
jgi:murein DD-endopeptidase MepM/ murein hydrolase activator NlpD